MVTPSLTLRRLAIFVAAAYAPCLLAAPAARIEFSTGEPVILGADGRERPARKGEQIVAGDRILTRAGRAQLAFADGAFVSLQPNTDFGVTEYNFAGRNDGNEKSVLSLLKGALRTVTGLIGRNKRDAYLMTTPTATIGIRGTGGRIEVNDQGTLVVGTSGTWFISTLGGTIDIPAGTTGFAGSNRQNPPTTVSGGPSTPPAGPLTVPAASFVAPDQVNSSGVTTVIGGSPTTGMPNGSGYAVTYFDPYLSSLNTQNPTAATFSGGTALATWGSGNSIGSATAIEVTNDGIIGWGRWTNGAVTTSGMPSALSGDQSVHYIVGVPTASMPTSGTGVAYNFLGATTPTWTNGAGTGTFNTSSSLTVDFVSSTLAYNLGIAIGGNTYTIANSGVSITGNTFIDSSPSISGTGAACFGGTNCSGSVNGFFAGSAAERAGLTYKVYDPAFSNTFVGAAAFKP